jgi:hypothetical protein
MGIDGLTIVQAIPGRIRLKVFQLKYDTELARAIPTWLNCLHGVQRAEASEITGTVLVVYDPEQLRPQDLAEMLPALFPGIAPKAIDLAQASSGPEAPPTATAVAEAISSFFGTLNAGVAQVTPGLDLSILFPLVLFGFGIRSLLVSEELVPVPWYNLLWFAFGAFFTLNRPKTSGSK